MQSVAGKSRTPGPPGTPMNEGTPPPERMCCSASWSSSAVDRPDVVRARLAKQVPPMLEVVEHYRAAGRLAEVDGRGSIDEVLAAILEAAT
jgi:adenylate kinase family enzyme